MLIINESATKKTSYLAWAGLGLMSVQFGVLARLTWWEYSWDIMEPITYFVTYGTAMACYAYFVLTKEVILKTGLQNRNFFENRSISSRPCYVIIIRLQSCIERFQ